mgnify:CR=1 FL=1
MGVCAVACVDDNGLNDLSREISRTFRLMTHDNRVDAHCLNRH